MKLAELRRSLAPRGRLQHAHLMIRAAVEQMAIRRRRDLPDRYFIRAGYRHRQIPEYFDDSMRKDIVYQPDVYPRAASIARELGARRIIDVGCGDGEKLAELHPEFEVVGIDFGPNIVTARERYSFGEWLEFDLDSNLNLPLNDQSLRSAVVVCADVIEHLQHPEFLLVQLSRCLVLCHAIVLSTPDRNLKRGWGDLGPPTNAAHVREWTIDELAGYLACSGFHKGTLEFTRSDDHSPLQHTILAIMYPG